jgi:dephospho-CoA kinase
VKKFGKKASLWYNVMKYIIGLTGNIATGKSAVLKMLEDLGARTIDADALVHQLMKKGTPTWQATVEDFGPDILTVEGEIDRARLGAIVFAQPVALRRLEEIVHPAVIARTKELIRQAEEAVVVIEAIKLIEAGMHRICDALWVVTCPEEEQLARLMKQRGLSEKEARTRLAAQGSQADKLALADVIIDNGGSLQETRRQVELEWAKIPIIHSGEGR